ncbi:MAG: hypothetical protein GY696_34715 [Gammaproteobacteria bacterium]|nr:hypothetical protein [Gammaproteobacteria bacterium]
MSNLLFFLSTAILTGAMGVDAAQAQVETVGLFLLGFIFALISYRCREFVQRRNFRLSCLGIAILCTAGLMVMSFLHKTMYLHLPIYGTLIACYHLGLATATSDVLENRVISFGQGPALMFATSIARSIEVLVSGSFLPIVAAVGAGYAWIPNLVTLICCFGLLLQRLAEKKSLDRLLYLEKGPRITDESEADVTDESTVSVFGSESSNVSQAGLGPKARTRWYDEDIVPMPQSSSFQNLYAPHATGQISSHSLRHGQFLHPSSQSRQGPYATRKMSRSLGDLSQLKKPKIPLIFPSDATTSSSRFHQRGSGGMRTSRSPASRMAAGQAPRHSQSSVTIGREAAEKGVRERSVTRGKTGQSSHQ